VEFSSQELVVLLIQSKVLSQGMDPELVVKGLQSDSEPYFGTLEELSDLRESCDVAIVGLKVEGLYSFYRCKIPVSL